MLNINFYVFAEVDLLAAPVGEGGTWFSRYSLTSSCNDVTCVQLRQELSCTCFCRTKLKKK